MANKAYLNCQTRLQAQEGWRKRLKEAGFFDRLPVETIAVDDALGRVTAQSVYARQSAPHYNSAAMDGIAVRASDSFGAQESAPVRLQLQTISTPFVAGCCYGVDTGDVMPPGTNAVIMVEDVHFDGAQAEIIAAAAPWQHVRIIGEDIVANELVVPEHQAISPVDIAALLAAGLETISVLAKPRVAVIPTGDEIVATYRELKPGAILDVNSHMLAAAVRDWRGEATRYPIVRDDPAALEQAVGEALAVNDIVVVNAGTSAGTEDFTATVLAGLGQVCCHGVAIRPGRPVILAVVEGKPVVGLPGYPVSCLLTAELFTQELLYEYQKKILPKRQTVKARLAQQVVSRLGVEEFLRVSLNAGETNPVAVPLARGASLISTLTQAQGLLRIDPETDKLNAGEMVSIELF